MSARETRDVSLPPEIDAFIDGRVASGRHRSAGEVVRAALRLIEGDERRREAPGAEADRPRGERAIGRR